MAQMLTPNAKLINDNFENHHISNKYDAVVMNPPYGNGSKMAMEHLKKAFGHLRDNGRVLAIVPQGSSMQKRLDEWYESKEAKDAVKVAEITLPSSTFKRAGLL